MDVTPWQLELLRALPRDGKPDGISAEAAMVLRQLPGRCAVWAEDEGREMVTTVFRQPRTYRACLLSEGLKLVQQPPPAETAAPLLAEALSTLRRFDAWMSSMWPAGPTDDIHPDAPGVWRTARAIIKRAEEAGA